MSRSVDVSDLAGEGGVTEAIATSDGSRVRRFTVAVVEGPAVGRRYESTADRCVIGSHVSTDVTLEDASVSRFHCEITLDDKGARLRDLGSKNGTSVDGVRVSDAFLREGSVIRIGRSSLRFALGTESNQLVVSDARRFGSLVGESVAMRVMFALLEKAAASDATVLLEGETGTGKEGAAESLHRAGGRAEQPFVVLDCSAIPPNLLESELFGHEKGAFTGAAGRRAGIFEEAQGGTVFLDEIGELHPDLQPKLLRVLERREVRRVGGNTAIKVDVRVIAATNRDLRAEVNAGRFRSDVYFRLAVLRIALPPLRQRPEDIPPLVASIVGDLRIDDTARARALDPAFLASLSRGVWPGNVRELRNHVERYLVLGDISSLETPPELPEAAVSVDPTVAYAEARRRAIEDFERHYVRALLDHHDGVVAAASRASGMDRVYLYRLMQRHGIRR